MSKSNCWDFKRCGRQPGGKHVEEFGECPAVHCCDAHGINSGINGGRACWAIAGTFCGGDVQGSFADKMLGCAACDFFHTVSREEGVNLATVPQILSIIGH